MINRQRSAKVGQASLAAFVRRLGRELAPPEPDSVAICLVSERRIREFNQRFRGRDRATDVLSFPGGGERDPDGHLHLGDILIAPGVARRQAREAGHSLARETRLLALHGYLHLLGYDHESDQGQMLALQRKLVRRLLPGKTPQRGKR